ncbi:retrovirus-related pol polyprotein line-1 [Plakobranchus ocellatus]|uniref:Retrovirus-related pol polyprotein line-1 n=1 Tax=Plakobranchus ocellatus TaxID=259542 RepID=A0AAV3YWW3_9GAST|nr:retrovirus-related pol polyprotein line-1 [Plakobranchus ocellatus]
MEMRCYRRLLGISYKDHITNVEVSRRIVNATGPHVDLLTIVRQRKLKWYGHTTRSSGLAKTIMQGSEIASFQLREERTLSLLVLPYFVLMLSPALLASGHKRRECEMVVAPFKLNLSAG